MSEMRPVAGCAGYLVAEDGHVWSSRKGPLRRLANGCDAHGYRTVHIRADDGRYVTRTVHSLVADAFLPPKPGDDHVVRHKNGQKRQCGRDNLEWGTRADNAQDAIRHGTMRVGAASHAAKLSEQQVCDIIAAIATGNMSDADIASQFGVTSVNIFLIRTGRTWKNVRRPWATTPRYKYKRNSSTRWIE